MPHLCIEGQSRLRVSMADPVRVMGICGTYSPDTANGRMLEIALGYCEELGAETVLWDNSVNTLPFFGEDGCWSHPVVEEYTGLASSSDAFILSSPEYHGTMSGVMKNHLDFLSFDQTTDKAFGLMSTLGGQSNSNTLNHMRIAVRWIHGWAVPEQVSVGNVESAFDDDGNLMDEKLDQRVRDLVASVVKTAEYLRGNR